MEQHFDSEVNTAGLNCPVPILRTRQALNTLSSGEVVKVLSTDPGAVKDFQAFCRQSGHTLLAQEQQAGAYVFYIQHT